MAPAIVCRNLSGWMVSVIPSSSARSDCIHAAISSENCIPSSEETPKSSCVETGSTVHHTQDTTLASYLNDMSKYNNLNEIKKTRLAYDNITVQFSKKNKRS